MADEKKPEVKKPETIQNVASKGPRVAIRPTGHIQATDIGLNDLPDIALPDLPDVIKGTNLDGLQ